MSSSQHASVAVVTASDDRYFPFLEGLLDSLHDASLPPAWRRCVLDVGLSDAQRADLTARGVEVVAAGWCLDFPGRVSCDVERRWFKAMVNRPFLSDLFLGHDAYLWIDCDAWVQSVSCLEEMVVAALQQQAVAIVLERFGRAVEFSVAAPDGSARIVAITEQSIRDNLARCYESCFGSETAHHAHGLVTNSGVFVIARESPAWKTWQEYLARGLRSGVRHTLVEQQALNLAFLENAIRYVPMPSRCNWNLTTLQPVWNDWLGALVDPGSPSVPIGVIHLTDLKDHAAIPLQDLGGQTLSLPLRYGPFRQWRDARLAEILSGAAQHRQAALCAALIREAGAVVRTGPFSGMRLSQETSWAGGKSPKLLGCYESELHPWIEHAIGRRPAVVVNVGCAEGYYAVGLARRLPDSRVIAFDADERARMLCLEASRLNGVANLEVFGVCTPDLLGDLVGLGPSLVVLDIEGAEKDLLSRDAVSRLDVADVIVECHEFVSPGITRHLAALFAASHRVLHVAEQSRDPNVFEVLGRVSSLDRWLAVCEFRPSCMNWLAAWRR